jgi:TonB-linked SusC/RagA family outer membrane protein
MIFFKHFKSVPDNYWLLKLFLIMRLTLALILFLNLQAVADAYSQAKVTLNLKSADFKSVLSKIEQQSNYHFVYSERKIPSAVKLDIQVQDKPVTQLLNEIFTGTGFTYNELDNHLIVIVPAGKTLNVVKATGKVLDEKGEPLPGASVKIKGTATGTQTDVNGNFSLDVPDNSVLEVSFVGYISKDVVVKGNEPIVVSLTVNGTNLNEVVVVGYGTQKKVNLTGAIATVGSERLDSRPMVNLGDGLQGLIPNLDVNMNNGQPGTKATFNIRGLTTITPGSTTPSITAPLVLIDGVARDPNLIDPNDVASVTVLKDAASAAIYGSRAANGVILITTKVGKKGPPRITYSGSYTASRPTQLVDQVNSLEYITMFNYANRSGLASGGYTTSPFTEKDSTMAAAYLRDPANNPTGYPDPGNLKKYRYVGNTDWMDVLYPGWAPQQQHNISLSGGQENTTYTASMGYFRQNGLEKTANQVFQRYTPSLKINTEVTKWLVVNLNLSLTHNDNNKPALTRINQGGAWLESNLPPVMPVRNPDGNYAGQGNYTNPIAVNDLSGRDINAQNDFWGTGRIILRPVNHLTVTADYTWNSYTELAKANLVPYKEYGVDGAFLNIFPWTNPSQVTENRRNDIYKAINAYATYENTFKKHYVKAMVGYNQEYYHYNIGNVKAINLIDPLLPAIGINSDPKPTVGGVETESALVGTFTRLNYIFDNKYLLEINARYDGTSRFRPDERYTFSPSISAGWNIAEEGFMRNIKSTINQLKLRASYGQLPDQLTPAGLPSSRVQYPYLGTQVTSTVPYLINGQPGITVGAPVLISPNYTWMKVQTTNFGLDYALLNEKLSGSFDYFITNSKDILVSSSQLPAVLGTAVPPSNSADLHTSGWELSVNWKDQTDNKVFYSATLSLANTANTEVTRYGANINNSLTDYRVGQQIGDIWGFINDGYYATDAEAASRDNSALAGYKWLAGDIKYRDLNGDGKINYGDRTLANPGDQKVIGNTTPHYKFGLNLNVSYKEFDFAAFIQGVAKRDFYPNEYVFYAFRDDEYSIPSKYSTDYWTPQNPNAFFPRVRFAGGGNEQSQDKYILSAAYARVKQLTLGYTLPKLLSSKMKLQRVRFYVTGANLFTFTPLNKNYDPEVAGFNTYPLNKSISFGLQATL